MHIEIQQETIGKDLVPQWEMRLTVINWFSTINKYLNDCSVWSCDDEDQDLLLLKINKSQSLPCPFEQPRIVTSE